MTKPPYAYHCIACNTWHAPGMCSASNRPSAAPSMVEHPPHYTFSKYEVIDVLQAWFPMDPLAWQVTKYVARYAHKNSAVQDLKKAEFYLKRLIAEVEARDKEQKCAT